MIFWILIKQNIVSLEINSTSSSLLFSPGHCIDEQFVEITSISRKQMFHLAQNVACSPLDRPLLDRREKN